MRYLISLTLFLLLFFSCENSTSNDGVEEYALNSNVLRETDMEMPHNIKAGDIARASSAINRKIIWSGDLELQVADVDKATSHIQDLAIKYGAFVSEMDMANSDHKISNRITIRVSSDQFTPFLNEIKGAAEYVREVHISSNDVTEEYIDIESRLKTKREVRERYIEILKNKTGKISDVLEAEEAIRKITEEIEAKEGRLRYLKDKIKFSTVHVLLYQKVEYKPLPSLYTKTFFDKAIDGFKNGWEIITGFLIGIINIWPLVLVLGIVVWKRKWIGKKLGKRK